MKNLIELSGKFFDLLEMDYSESEFKNSENDKLCFENALKRFLKSGKKEDAFTVYFCFCEIFKLFGQGYENTQKLLELLSDHEYHSGELLSKHRDHYSHSVYVFTLGIAIYAADAQYRRTYLNFYSREDNGKSAFYFLKFWGITSLFHDIGYPFQLAHEQIKSYAEEVWASGEKDKKKREHIMANMLYVTYGNVQRFIAIDDKAKRNLIKAFPKAKINNINDLLSYGIYIREGYDIEKVCNKLVERVEEQREFMDHAYFSSVILAKHFFAVDDFVPNIDYLDVLTGILLHNNFNKYDVPNAHPINVNEHPLSYLLILCDELQCWDRMAYGKISKRDPIAWDVNLEIFENRIVIKYFYDSFYTQKEDEDGNPDSYRNKNYDEMLKGIFSEKILGSNVIRGEGYVKKWRESNLNEPDKSKHIKIYDGYISSPLTLNVQMVEAKKPKKYKLYASDDSFINLCDLAKAIHNSYNDHCSGLSAFYMNTSFGELPLEFKVSNIEQAKSYADKLELINCFYSSKDLDYPIIEDFRCAESSSFKDNLSFLCREEHVRWVKEKLDMGWKYGTDYDPNDRADRDKKKINKAIVPYEELSKDERSKDELMINNIIRLLKKFDSNIRIYNYRSGRKPNLEISGTGHRFIKGDNGTIERYKQDIKNILNDYNKNYRVVVRTCFGHGADQLIAECAVELGITIKAYLPMNYEDFIKDVRQDAIANGQPYSQEDELRLRHLLAQTVVCKTISDPVFTYAAASEYIVDKCDVLIALWDGKKTELYDNNNNPINRGGTYDCIQMAQKRDKKVHIIECLR